MPQSADPVEEDRAMDAPAETRSRAVRTPGRAIEMQTLDLPTLRIRRQYRTRSEDHRQDVPSLSAALTPRPAFPNSPRHERETGGLLPAISPPPSCTPEWLGRIHLGPPRQARCMSGLRRLPDANP